MCLSSLRKKACFRNDCKFVHTTGTRRRKSKPESDKEPDILKSSDTTRHAEQDTETQPQSNPFLEALQAMREEIMKELDKKLATIHVQNPMSLNQSLPKIDQQKTTHSLAGGQSQFTSQNHLIGGQMIEASQPQGMHRGQQVMLVPMQMSR